MRRSRIAVGAEMSQREGSIEFDEMWISTMGRYIFVSLVVWILAQIYCNSIPPPAFVFVHCLFMLAFHHVQRDCCVVHAFSLYYVQGYIAYNLSYVSTMRSKIE